MSIFRLWVEVVLVRFGASGCGFWVVRMRFGAQVGVCAAFFL